MLAAKSKGDPAAAHPHVTLAQSRDPVRAKALRVALVTDAKPAEIDQPDRDGCSPFERQRLELDVLGHHGAQLGQPLTEEDQLVELRLLLLCAELRVVEVLHAAR